MCVDIQSLSQELQPIIQLHRYTLLSLTNGFAEMRGVGENVFHILLE